MRGQHIEHQLDFKEECEKPTAPSIIKLAVLIRHLTKLSIEYITLGLKTTRFFIKHPPLPETGKIQTKNAQLTNKSIFDFN